MRETEQSQIMVSSLPRAELGRPLSALLSQVLVAFTIELDNEFERRMTESGYAGARLSLVVWLNLMRFIGKGGASIRELAAQAFDPEERTKFRLGCLERWGFVVLAPGPGEKPVCLRMHRQAGRELRDGWGSGRGVGANWTVRLTTKGAKANAVWTPLVGEIEKRWEARFGAEPIRRLRAPMAAILSKLDVELPHGLPESLLVIEAREYPPRVTRDVAPLGLPALLSQLLLAFTIEFEREARVSLALSANALRVLGENPVRLSDILRLTGGSPECSGIGWQIKPCVTVEADPNAKRGKAARLTPRGMKARETYFRLVAEIEKEWLTRFGKDAINRLRASLEALFDKHCEGRPLLSAGLIPPQGAVRAGNRAPALGRRNVGVAACQRMKDMVVQTDDFIRDPAGTLPHYPLWDMNRGFGP
jgi:hypothetical protein